MCTRPHRRAVREDTEAVEEEEPASRYPEVIAARLIPTGGHPAGLFP